VPCDWYFYLASCSGTVLEQEVLDRTRSERVVRSPNRGHTGSVSVVVCHKTGSYREYGSAALGTVI